MILISQTSNCSNCWCLHVLDVLLHDMYFCWFVPIVWDLHQLKHPGAALTATSQTKHIFFHHPCLNHTWSLSGNENQIFSIPHFPFSSAKALLPANIALKGSKDVQYLAIALNKTYTSQQRWSSQSSSIIKYIPDIPTSSNQPYYFNN